MNDTQNRIISLLDASGKDDTVIERELGLPRSTIYDWRNGRSKSYRNYLQQIAIYFSVSVDYIMGNEQKNKLVAHSDELGPKGHVIWDKLKEIKSVSEEDYELAVAQLDLILKRRDNRDKH